MISLREKMTDFTDSFGRSSIFEKKYEEQFQDARLAKLEQKILELEAQV